MFVTIYITICSMSVTYGLQKFRNKCKYNSFLVKFFMHQFCRSSAVSWSVAREITCASKPPTAGPMTKPMPQDVLIYDESNKIKQTNILQIGMKLM